MTWSSSERSELYVTPCIHSSILWYESGERNLGNLSHPSEYPQWHRDTGFHCAGGHWTDWLVCFRFTCAPRLQFLNLPLALKKQKLYRQWIVMVTCEYKLPFGCYYMIIWHKCCIFLFKKAVSHQSFVTIWAYQSVLPMLIIYLYSLWSLNPHVIICQKCNFLNILS